MMGNVMILLIHASVAVPKTHVVLVVHQATREAIARIGHGIAREREKLLLLVIRRRMCHAIAVMIYGNVIKVGIPQEMLLAVVHQVIVAGNVKQIEIVPIL